MKHGPRANISLLLFLLVLSIAAPGYAGEFKVTRVYDGDTVKVEGYDVEIKVRLVGIDAPETSLKKREEGQPFSQQATKYLASLVLNKTWTLGAMGLIGTEGSLGSSRSVERT